MGNTKAKWWNGQLTFYDGVTFETVKPLAPIVMVDDFFGDTLNADIWTLINVGAGSTVQAASNLTMTQNVAGATDENGIYQKDDKGGDRRIHHRDGISKYIKKPSLNI